MSAKLLDSTAGVLRCSFTRCKIRAVPGSTERLSFLTTDAVSRKRNQGVVEGSLGGHRLGDSKGFLGFHVKPRFFFSLLEL